MATELTNLINCPVPDSPRFQQDTAMAIARLRAALGPAGTPSFGSMALLDLTADSLVYADTDKVLQSVTLGTSLSFSAPTLNTIQGIRTIDSPTFATVSCVSTDYPAASIDASGNTATYPVLQFKADRATAVTCGSLTAYNMGATPCVNMVFKRGTTDTDGSFELYTSNVLRVSVGETGSTVFGGSLYSGSTIQAVTGFIHNGVSGVTESSAGVPTSLTIGGGIVTAISRSGSAKFGDGGTTNYSQFSATGDLTFVGSAGFYPRFLAQAEGPAAGTGATQCDTSELVVWKDSDDSKVYVCFNDNGTVKTVELSGLITVPTGTPIGLLLVLTH